jgi:hypothetical protein
MHTGATSRKQSSLRNLIAVFSLLALAACADDPPPAPSTPTPDLPEPVPTSVSVLNPVPSIIPNAMIPGSNATPVDGAQVTPEPTVPTDLPSPTAVTSTGQGDQKSAISALAGLKTPAVEWQDDVQLAMLANVRPGQQDKLLNVGLGDPDVFEPTPGGLGRNWTLVAVSPSRGAVAVSADGTLVDLSSGGGVSGETLGAFADPRLSPLTLSSLNLASLKDTNVIWQQLSGRLQGEGGSIALLSPDGFSMGPVSTESRPLLIYQLFGTGSAQMFALFDAYTGQMLEGTGGP